MSGSAAAAARALRGSAGAIVMLAIAPAFACGATGFEAPEQVEGLPIRRIEVVTRNLYDPVPPGRLGPLLRLTNRLHATTRGGVVRSHLLFAPGDPWSGARGQETARTLRALDILEPVRLEAHRAGDSVDVRVETRDAWTTAPEFAIESGGGQQFVTVAVVERNLLGLGKSLAFAYHETPEGVSRSTSFQDPGVRGSRWRAGISGDTGSEGARQSVEAILPFYAEDAPRSYGVRWSRVTSVARLFMEGEEAAAFDRRREEGELWWGRGARRGGTIRRLTGTFLLRNLRFGPSRTDSAAPGGFEGGEENLRTRLLSLEARWWRPRFHEWTGIDRLGSIEDIDLGPSLRLIAGASPSWLGASASEAYAAVRLDHGIVLGERRYAQAAVDFRTWLGDEPRERLTRLRARWVEMPRPGHTLIAAAAATAGFRMPRDFQEIVGGLSGLRAYPVREIAATRVVRFNLEHRWLITREAFQFVSLGAAGFYDAARGAGLGAGESGWHQDLGFGLRLSLPRSSRERVARFDVAWPLAPAPDGRRDPVFSFGSGQAF